MSALASTFPSLATQRDARAFPLSLFLLLSRLPVIPMQRASSRFHCVYVMALPPLSLTPTLDQPRLLCGDVTLRQQRRGRERAREIYASGGREAFPLKGTGIRGLHSKIRRRRSCQDSSPEACLPPLACVRVCVLGDNQSGRQRAALASCPQATDAGKPDVSPVPV